MLLVAGLPLPNGVPNASVIAKWNGQAWGALGAGLFGGEGRALAVHADAGGPVLYCGGSFAMVAPPSILRVARFRNGQWLPMGAGLNGEVLALQIFDDGSGPALYAAGKFTASGSTPLNHIARWDGTAWQPLGQGIFGGDVQGLGVFDDDGAGPLPPALYAVGNFALAGGVPSMGIARWGSCTPTCTADLDHSGAVNGADLGILLGNWGAPGCGGAASCVADLDGDGAVGGADLGLLLGAWGSCAP